MKLEKLVYDEINANIGNKSNSQKSAQIQYVVKEVQKTKKATLVITPIYIGNTSRTIYQCRNCGLKLSGVDSLYRDDSLRYCPKCGAKFDKVERERPQHLSRPNFLYGD